MCFILICGTKIRYRFGTSNFKSIKTINKGYNNIVAVLIYGSLKKAPFLFGGNNERNNKTI